ncbi:hypothetical protein TNCV_4314931 [Trichonephila clavipes]|nr:hypothetical protein TNCV_4314931 [Trichonephila clavipes]
MEWRHTASPVTIKANQMLSKHKIMTTVFWDWRGVLLVDFMPHGTTNDQLRCLLRNSLEAPKSITKQMPRHAVKRCFAPPR